MTNTIRKNKSQVLWSPICLNNPGFGPAPFLKGCHAF